MKTEEEIDLQGTGVSIHPTAIVSPGAEIGSDVSVGAYSLVGPNVRVGDRTRIRSHVVLEGHTTLGEECDLFQFSSVGAPPQDLKYRGEPSTLVLGVRNIVREYVTMQPGTKTGNMTTVVGDGNLFMATSHVAHDCVIGSNNIFSNGVGLAGHVTVGNSAILGGMVGIHQFTRIGDFAFLSAGSMVGLDIPPYCIGQGDRCRLRGLNLVGLGRAGFSDEDISLIKRTYRHLFSAGSQYKDGLKSIPEEFSINPRVAFMLDFIRDSERGVCTPQRNNED